MLAVAVLVLRIGSHKYPSVKAVRTVPAAADAEKPA